MVFAYFFSPHFFLPEPASESHHITALNQINVTEGSKGGEKKHFGCAGIKFGVANLFTGLFSPFYSPSKLTFFWIFIQEQKRMSEIEDEG